MAAPRAYGCGAGGLVHVVKKEGMMTRIGDEALETLFTRARTFNAWRSEPVPDDLLRELYGLVRLGPTSANCSPARFVFVRTPAGKEKLRPSLSKGNLDKTMAAPVTVMFTETLAPSSGSLPIAVASNVSFT